MTSPHGASQTPDGSSECPLLRAVLVAPGVHFINKKTRKLFSEEED